MKKILLMSMLAALSGCIVPGDVVYTTPATRNSTTLSVENEYNNASSVTVVKQTTPTVVVVEKTAPAPVVIVEKSRPAPVVIVEKSHPSPVMVVRDGQNHHGGAIHNQGHPVVATRPGPQNQGGHAQQGRGVVKNIVNCKQNPNAANCIK